MSSKSNHLVSFVFTLMTMVAAFLHWCFSRLSGQSVLRQSFWMNWTEKQSQARCNCVFAFWGFKSGCTIQNNSPHLNDFGKLFLKVLSWNVWICTSVEYVWSLADQYLSWDELWRRKIWSLRQSKGSTDDFTCPRRIRRTVSNSVGRNLQNWRYELEHCRLLRKTSWARAERSEHLSSALFPSASPSPLFLLKAFAIQKKTQNTIDVDVGDISQFYEGKRASA